MKKITLLLFIIAFPVLSFAENKDVVHHPAPKDPIYIDGKLYNSVKANVPKPPEMQSSSQKNDEAELLKLQKSRTTADCAQAKEEVFVSLKSFYGKPSGTLNPPEVEKLSAFFEQIRNDADFFIQQMKKDFPRQRPFLYMKDINPCVPKEVTGAYPSGHATLSRLYALILSDLFPDRKATFESRSLEIGKHRVLVGMHHPTDIESGRKLAELLYGEFKLSKKYQEAVSKLK